MLIVLCDLMIFLMFSCPQHPKKYTIKISDITAKPFPHHSKGCPLVSSTMGYSGKSSTSPMSLMIPQRPRQFRNWPFEGLGPLPTYQQNGMIWGSYLTKYRYVISGYSGYITVVNIYDTIQIIIYNAYPCVYIYAQEHIAKMIKLSAQGTYSSC